MIEEPTNVNNSKQKNRQCNGFTLAELLIALMVGSIVLAAAATMAGAMSNGKSATERMSRNAAYRTQLQLRLSDLVMCAESISSRAGGVDLGYPDGHIVSLYTDDTQRIVVENNSVYAYWSDPGQANVAITAVSGERVAIAYDLIENGQSQRYRMTAGRRGGQ